MAQARVTDFFHSRKRNGTLQPSKRRKLQHGDSEAITERSISSQDSLPNVTKVDPKSTDCEPTLTKLNVPSASVSATKPNTRARTRNATRSVTNASVKAKTSARVKQSRAKNVQLDQAPVISDEQAQRQSVEPQAQGANSNPAGGGEKNEPSCDFVPTAICDDHCPSPVSTPTKRSNINAELQQTTEIAGKRSRSTKVVRRDLLLELAKPDKTPNEEKGFDFQPFVQNKMQNKSSRRKLLLSKNVPQSESDVENKTSKPFTENEAASETNEKSVSTSDGNSTASKQGNDAANPSIQPIEQKVKQVEKSNANRPNTVPDPKMNISSMKQRLKKCGNLAELKQRLADFGKISQPTKKVVPDVSAESKVAPPVSKTEPKQESSKKVVPAYERYHALAEAVPPSLTLPLKYRVLADMFRGVDTVVGMLQKRSELCTFSKLKAAVQQMCRRTFQLDNLGQMKTVYPSAYTLRQEKDLFYFGVKKSGYQLTIEAKIDNKGCESKAKAANLSASQMLERRSTFHRNLINIVKKHHKEFLARLDRPLTVPDVKLTRWHPKFELDSVPDVVVSTLPQRPDDQVMTTARAVLDHTSGQHMERVRKALETVAAASTTSKPASNVANAKPDQSTAMRNGGAKQNDQLKNVPQSLLERIRAKEAQKVEADMMRTPQESEKLIMIGRLPEIARIIRNFFVVQKKPALLEEDVIQKVSDSYHTNISKVEVEKHLKLLADLLPDWLSVVVVRKGRFVKIDKNRDINSVGSALEKILKSKQ